MARSVNLKSHGVLSQSERQLSVVGRNKYSEVPAQEWHKALVLPKLRCAGSGLLG